MNTASLLNFLLGISFTFWPFATLFVKKNVLDTQWLEMTAIFLFGITMMLYSCMMNSFLCDEIIIDLLFMVFALIIPPLTLASVARLTRVGGITLRFRLHFVIPIVTVAVISALIAFGDRTVFRNIFIAVLALELVITAVYLVRQMQLLRRMLDKYYSSNHNRNKSIHTIIVCIIVIGALSVSTIALFPMHQVQPLWYTVAACFTMGITVYLLGKTTYRLDYGVERIKRDTPVVRGGDPSKVGKEMCTYVENEGYRNPDLSVFDLAKRYRISQDDVVDIIHNLHGCTFSEYIDSMRIEHVTGMLLTGEHDIDDPATMERISHQCGYLSAEGLRQAYKDAMGQDIGKLRK